MRAVWLAFSLFVALNLAVARADQASWVTKAQADRAAALVKDSKEVRQFCPPCGDNGWKPMAIMETSVEPTENPEFHSLFINWTPVDLAYVYYPEKGKWANLAIRVGASVSDVPEFLPDTVPGYPPDSMRVHLRGTIGENRPVFMSLWKDYTSLNGDYAYVRFGLPIQLQGVIDKEGAFTITELSNDKKTGLFNGRFESVMAKANGTWMNPDLSKSLPFSLTLLATQQNVDEYVEDQTMPKSLHMDYPVFAWPDATRADALNKAIQDDLHRQLEAFNATWTEMVADMKKNAPETAPEPTPAETPETEQTGDDEGMDEGDYLPTASFSLGNYGFEYAGDSLISLLFSMDTYTGGAHGYGTYVTFTFQLGAADVKQLSLDDLFTAGTDYRKTLETICLAKLKEDGAGFVIDGTVSELKEEDLNLFTVSAGGITIYFPPYAVGSYAEGPREVLIPFDAVKDIVNTSVLSEVLKKG
ncbi:MAG: hypothetical protein AMXMBFR84_04980 [Candidatus Hydrogenedentota bacterium]